MTIEIPLNLPIGLSVLPANFIFFTNKPELFDAVDKVHLIDQTTHVNGHRKIEKLPRIDMGEEHRFYASIPED